MSGAWTLRFLNGSHDPPPILRSTPFGERRIPIGCRRRSGARQRGCAADEAASARRRAQRRGARRRRSRAAAGRGVDRTDAARCRDGSLDSRAGLPGGGRGLAPLRRFYSSSVSDVLRLRTQAAAGRRSAHLSRSPPGSGCRRGALGRGRLPRGRGWQSSSRVHVGGARLPRPACDGQGRAGRASRPRSAPARLARSPRAPSSAPRASLRTCSRARRAPARR